MKTEIQFLRHLRKVPSKDIYSCIEERIDALTSREDASFFDDPILDELFKEYVSDWEQERRKKMTSTRMNKRIKMINLFDGFPDLQLRLVQFNLDQLYEGFVVPDELKRQMQKMHTPKNQINGTSEKIGRGPVASPEELQSRFEY